MPSTPSPSGRRLRTPPAPGPGSDIFEPYSPRRSKRSTAANNPYGSFNSETSPSKLIVTPPSHKKAHLAGPSTQLTSPPSSPASPARQRPHKTPGKTSRTSILPETQHISTSLTTIQPTSSNMLPTPLKTPKKRHTAALASTSRVLNFRPDHLNDVMPTSRDKVKRSAVPRQSNGFELYDEKRGRDIPIFTDSSARVPEVDNSEENPFFGPKKPASTKQRKSSRRPGNEAERIKQAVRNDEGIQYMHRGQAIFRKFQSDDGSVASDSSVLSPQQRKVARSAGVAATRPLTRSEIKPRLLWPSQEQKMDRERKANEIDEEAMTDIEMPEASLVNEKSTPGKSMQATPPATHRTTRSHQIDEEVLDSAEGSFSQDDDSMAIETPGGLPIATSSKKNSPFDAWPRTKAGRKRAGESAEVGTGGGKRTRNQT